MPRFTPNGPIVPDQLVQALEDDRVVIFCGAGISMGAGLPSYAGLVTHCFNELGEPLPPNKSVDWLWPDRMLGALEARYGPEAVRRKAAERLAIAPTDLAIHQAILRLARMRHSDGVRLVTTNFDTFFEDAKSGLRLGHEFHSGPILPIPRNDRISSWKSLVYLHGRLEPHDRGNQHLVLTSADFGRAYLTEAWAARFVSRLFSDFTVLFIGYSLNDPVLRYMTDTFAAEDALSRADQPRGPAYIFVPHKKAAPDPGVWRDRRLEPIFYNETHKHLRLKRTLIAWADAREDYLSNTRVMINRIAPSPPEASDPSATANLVWAVVGRPDDGGHGARAFAKLDPTAPVQWLFEFERHDADLRDRHVQAVADAVASGRAPPSEPTYSVTPLFPSRVDNRIEPIDDTAAALIGWLARSLGQAQLIEWTIGKFGAGRRPHSFLRFAIRQSLNEPTVIPDGIRLFWRIVSSEGDWIAAPLSPNAIWDFRTAIATHRDSAWMLQDFLWACAPHLLLEASYYRAYRSAAGLPESDDAEFGGRLRDIADAKVRLNGEELLSDLIRAVDTTPSPDGFWAENLDSLTAQFRRVLDLYAVADLANDATDPTAVERPSIVPHAQNQNHNKWGLLIDIIWRGWVHIDRTSPELSRQYVASWRRVPFLGFRRLVLAAIAASAHFSADEKLEALLNG
jgi:hypothetical protein